MANRLNGIVIIPVVLVVRYVNIWITDIEMSGCKTYSANNILSIANRQKLCRSRHKIKKRRDKNKSINVCLVQIGHIRCYGATHAGPE